MLIVRAVQIKNRGGIADYRSAVLVNERVIWSGTVKGHDREDGWIALVRMIASQAEKEGRHE